MYSVYAQDGWATIMDETGHDLVTINRRIVDDELRQTEDMHDYRDLTDDEFQDLVDAIAEAVAKISRRPAKE
jgi:hypothetical protein